MSPRRTISILVTHDGTARTRTYRLPLWAFRGGVVALVGISLLLVLAVTFFGPLAREAARVPGLTEEVSRLRTENAKVRELASELDSLEARYGRLRELMGSDLAPDPLALGSSVPVAPPVFARAPGAPPKYELGPSGPKHWPLDEPGYITRGLVGPGEPDEPHPGLDIAVPTGTLVRAVGGGEVLQIGQDPEYGIFVLIRHPGGYTSRYGHLSAITARQGSAIQAGEVLGLSGNTGRSSAPHLHLEIRKDGAVIDPRTVVKENR